MLTCKCSHWIGFRESTWLSQEHVNLKKNSTPTDSKVSSFKAALKCCWHSNTTPGFDAALLQHVYRSLLSSHLFFTEHRAEVWCYLKKKQPFSVSFLVQCIFWKGEICLLIFLFSCIFYFLKFLSFQNLSFVSYSLNTFSLFLLLKLFIQGKILWVQGSEKAVSVSALQIRGMEIKIA